MTETFQIYDANVVAWVRQQAQLMRAGRFGALDIEHIAEEIEDVSKSEQRELESRMAMLLAHLLKWERQPERRGPSWEAIIRHQPERIVRRLERIPSLKASLSDPDWCADTWGDARLETARETGIWFDLLPADCSWSAAEILDHGLWPAPGRAP